MIDLTTYTDADLETLRQGVAVEIERRQILATAALQTKIMNDQYATAVAKEKPVPAASIPDALGPGQAIVWTDGNTWRNKSGAWLPKTANPSTYPLGWRQETGLATASAWSAASVAYKVGDLITYQSKTYRCLSAHTSQAAWMPTAAVSLWTLA